QPAAGCCRTHRWTNEQSARPDAADTDHRYPGPDCSPGQKAVAAPAETVAVGDGFRTTMASGSEPTEDSIVLTDPLLLEHDAAGSWRKPWETFVEETGERPGHYLLPSRPIRTQLLPSPLPASRSVDQGLD